MHESVELSNGKVALLGGFDRQSQIEVLDLKSATTELLSADLLPVKSGFTYLADDKNRCVIFGGKGLKDSVSTVFRIDFDRRKTEHLQNLTVARGYFEPTKIQTVPQNVINLSAGVLVISGGHVGITNEFWGPRWLKSAEVYHLNKAI